MINAQNHYAVGRKTQQYILVWEQPNYPDETYCNNCKKRWPKVQRVCAICGYKVRIGPKKKGKLNLPRH